LSISSFVKRLIDIHGRHDLSLAVSGDLTLAHWLFRCTGLEKDHPAMQTWIRISAGYRRIRDKWQIVHEHASVPFDPQTAQAAFTLEPQSNQ
jgi:ketosteroid isomerase-like protein